MVYLQRLKCFTVAAAEEDFSMKFFKSFIFASILLLLFTSAGNSTANAQTIRGILKTLQGKRILNVWGNNFEMGFAHGYLLANDIVTLLEDYMLGTLYDAENYERTVRLIKIYIKVPAPFRNELEGMHQGMQTALGMNGMFSARLKRHYEPADLLAWNLVPDIFRLRFNARSFFNSFTGDYAPGFCSSISAWGEGAFNGNTLIARDLDFGFPGDLLDQTSIIIAYQPSSFFKQQWVSIGWPGLIGCLTGMNEEGVGAALNLDYAGPDLDDLLIPIGDAYIGIPRYYTPVMFALRKAVENKRIIFYRNDPLGNFLNIMRITNITGAFNIHLFTPYREGMKPQYPAVILECNSNGTALRTPADNQQWEPFLLSDTFLAVTNHNRKLRNPIDCLRYETLVNRLNDISVLTMEQALAIEREVAQTSGPYNTVQVIGLMPETRELWVSFRDGQTPAWEAKPAHFQWNELFKK